MSTSQTFSTSDLRSNAVDYKRDNDNKSKWARGEIVKSGRHGHGAPVKVKPTSAHIYPALKTNHRAHMVRHNQILDDTETASPDSSADEDVPEPSAAPEPDAEIAYSFDAAHGPSQGSQILSLAVAKAVERYESSVTDKIVRSEWEVLDESGEVLPKQMAGGKKGAKRAGGGMGELEAEYEFV